MATVRLYDANGKEHDKLSLNVDFTKKDVSPKTYSCAIKRLNQNYRQGTVACKSRGEVAFSTKKPWKQKGTGRARAGSLRSPLWRKGGTIFGPQPRTRKLSINKKQNRLVFNNILSLFLNDDLIHCLDFEGSKTPKTKEAAKMLKAMGLFGKKVTLLLSHDDSVNFASFRNIPYVNILYFDQPCAFELSNSDCWLVLKKDLDLLKGMIVQWN